MGLMKPRVSSYVDRGNELIAKGKTKQAMNMVSHGLQYYSERVIDSISPYAKNDAGLIAGKYEIIGKKKEELVPMLKSLRATGGTAYNDMIAVLDATVEAVNKSGVFSEVGKSGHGSVHVSDAEGKIEGIAKSYMQKEPSMSYTDALAKAWEDNPDLMDAYDAEEGF